MPALNKRIAILGSGFGASVTAPALRAEGWEIVALFSRRAERAAEIADELSIPHRTNDYQALVNRDDIDAVVVSTPTSTHREIVLAALQAGKHVLAEKPLAMTTAEAQDMVDAAAASDRTCMVNFEFRHSVHQLQISRLIEEGKIGRPQSAVATLYVARNLHVYGGAGWRSRLEMGGGALYQQGSHYFDTLRGWMGEITSVYAHVAVHEPLRVDPESGERSQADADDFLSATLTFESGAAATMTMIWSGRSPSVGDLHITGPGGTIAHHGPLGLFSPGPVTHTPPIDIEAGPDAPLGEESAPLPVPAEIEPLPEVEIVAASRRLLRDFERGIVEGTSPSPNFLDGLRTQLVLDAARESARTGRVVEIPPA